MFAKVTATFYNAALIIFALHAKFDVFPIFADSRPQFGQGKSTVVLIRVR